MAYRRRQGITKATTFKEEISHEDGNGKAFRSSQSFPSNSSLAAKAIRASASHRDSPPQVHSFNAYEDASSNESRGFWGILAQKAKAILEDDGVSPESRTPKPQVQSNQAYPSNDGYRTADNPTIRKSIDKLTSSLNQIGDSFEKAFEEGRMIVENKTADIIEETRKLQIRRKGAASSEVENQTSGGSNPWLQPASHHESQIKASRDVAMATAAKAKLLLRELKTVKADLAFAKERCAQLEEENRRLRDSREKGSNPADDDLIRLQLETLLAEKARLAHENSIYARENRFLREIVEYHQLTDIMDIDEGIEEVAEVNPPVTRTLSVTSFSPSQSPPSSPASPSHLPITKEIYPLLYDADDTVTPTPSLPDPLDAN